MKENENKEIRIWMVQSFLHNCTIAKYKQENVGTYFLQDIARASSHSER